MAIVLQGRVEDINCSMQINPQFVAIKTEFELSRNYSPLVRDNHNISGQISPGTSGRERSHQQFAKSGSVNCKYTWVLVGNSAIKASWGAR